MSHNFIVKDHIKEQLKKLPHNPGVYIMKDHEGEIIYVGKSKNLKNRVSSYFRGFNAHMPKVQTMVINIAEFEYFITDNEVEALILEANLIKKHLPRFNILLKDDKMYPFILVTVEEEFPRVLMTRNYSGKGKHFGPYVSTDQVRKTLEVIQTIFPLRECSKKITSKIDRPCLNFHIGRCAGACNHAISKEDYRMYVNQVLRFLNGDRDWLMSDLKQQMLKAAELLNFEIAAEIRDKINALEALNEKQKAIQANDKNQDFIAFYNFEERTCVMLFQVRGGKIEGRESHNISNALGMSASDILTSFITQYYSGALMIPKEIYLSDEIEMKELYSDWLTKLLGTKVEIHIPQKGEKKKLIDLVSKNAKEYIIKFQEKIDKEIRFRESAESELKDLLGMPQNMKLRRLEAYDISNTSGVYSVGSMVVFEAGKKKRSDYRRYRIKTIEGANDYGSMQEVLYRRFKRGLEEQNFASENGIGEGKFIHFPDVILIDGGKGHVNAVQDVLTALKIDIPCVGMVKDDYHKTEDLYYHGEICGLKQKNNAFKLIYEIQEEVHRFAIEYHKSLRSKEMTSSILDEIVGIGDKRKIALLKQFHSIENMRAATVLELEKVEGIHKTVAQSIYDYFHTKDAVEKSENSDE
ncbi:excinuclease ABC subunit UvrC [Fusibacter sp. 3D3]|uniref:excinuclease ABC subunit UvrC n=1 Tax=Fusibacter sp. 3D3 TaxID=1048380 RepID=UPI0008538D25|nr:excinuclease ABC subunit UvrC [Fusibacter sp. 3D3]GAU78018.1 excinuclease ABC subunit C [Fusibacter sp. 3D3]